MTDPSGEQDDGTELSSEEREGLIPSYITLRSELNDAELTNISEGTEWASRSRRRDVLDEEFLKTLHRRMFGNVWKWAGHYRSSGKNIGVEAYKIGTDLNQLIEDTRFRIEHESFPTDEIAARFHHRLVQIHCFPNGNGRHARLATDLLLAKLGADPFTWGRQNLMNAGEVRRRYIEALQAADRHDFTALLEFVRS